jgi:hypothetical protein
LNPTADSLSLERSADANVAVSNGNVSVTFTFVTMSCSTVKKDGPPEMTKRSGPDGLTRYISCTCATVSVRVMPLASPSTVRG